MLCTSEMCYALDHLEILCPNCDGIVTNCDSFLLDEDYGKLPLFFARPDARSYGRSLSLRLERLRQPLVGPADSTKQTKGLRVRNG